MILYPPLGKKMKDKYKSAEEEREDSFASIEGLAQSKSCCLWVISHPVSQLGGVSWKTNAFLVWCAESWGDKTAGRFSNEFTLIPGATCQDSKQTGV